MTSHEKRPLSTRFSISEAHAKQWSLSKRVVRRDMLPKTLHYIAGVDVAYTENQSVGAVAVLDYASLSVRETRCAVVKTRFPYIPTLLSFREIKPAQAAIKKLRTNPDVFLVDAQGIAHPYRLGFASHLGILLDKPTIGVAKSLLCGHVAPQNQEGWMPIIDKNEVIGAAIKKDEKTKPVFISIGHKVSLERAVEIVKHCTLSERIPEPIKIAHTIANEEKKKRKKENTQPTLKK